MDEPLVDCAGFTRVVFITIIYIKKKESNLISEFTLTYLANGGFKAHDEEPNEKGKTTKIIPVNAGGYVGLSVHRTCVVVYIQMWPFALRKVIIIIIFFKQMICSFYDSKRKLLVCRDIVGRA